MDRPGEGRGTEISPRIHHSDDAIGHLALTVVDPGVVQRAHSAAGAAVDHFFLLLLLLLLLLLVVVSVQQLHLLDDDGNALLQRVQNVLVGIGVAKNGVV